MILTCARTISGQVRIGKDLTEQHFLFIGTLGLLLVGPKAHEYDAFVVPYCNLQAMMLSAGTVYERSVLPQHAYVNTHGRHESVRESERKRTWCVRACAHTNESCLAYDASLFSCVFTWLFYVT